MRMKTLATTRLKAAPSTGKGSWLFTIPEVPEQVVVPWILSQQGEAIPLEPPEIVEAVRAAAAKLLTKLADQPR